MGSSGLDVGARLRRASSRRSPATGWTIWSSPEQGQTLHALSWSRLALEWDADAW